MTLQWLWPSPLEKLRITDGMHSLEWKPFTKQEVYTISINVCPRVLTEVYHQPWDEPATYRYLTMSRTWSDSSNAWEITGFLFGMQHDLRFQEIPGLYTVYIHITQKKKQRHRINIPTSIPSCTTGRNLFPLFWHKGRFPQRFTTVPMAHEVGAGATNTGGAWIHSQVQSGWRKITRFLSFFKSGGMSDPRFGNRFFWSSFS